MTENTETPISPAETASAPEAKSKKPFFKKWWVWAIAGVFVIGIAVSANGGSSSETPADSVTEKATDTTTEVVEEPAKPEEPAEPDVPAEYKSALNKAQSYSDNMHMSKAGIYDQLVSEYGEQFSPEAAQYGVDNVKADWNANALEKAKSYQETMSMSPSAIHDQLTSEYGEKFTVEEADYAIANLNS